MKKKLHAHRPRKFRMTPIIFAGILFPILIALSVIFLSRQTVIVSTVTKASGSVSTLCKAPNGAIMGMDEAITLAKNGTCGKSGVITSVPYCNSSTGYWFMDLDLWNGNLLCKPACVVSVANKSVEINYRCTGVGPRDDDRCERTGCQSEICQDEPLSPVVTSCTQKPEHTCYQKYAACTVQSNGHCGFSVSTQFSDCMTQTKCQWCGNECVGETRQNCNTAIPSSTQVCQWKDNRCQALEAPCSWCGESCERNTPGKNCVKGSSVPSGLSCDSIGTSGKCQVTGLPPVVQPTNGPGYCDASCEKSSDCIGWLSCYVVEGGVKRCRKPQCQGEHDCYCRNTPTPIKPNVQTIIRRIIVKVTATPTNTPIVSDTPIATGSITPTGIGSVTPSLTATTTGALTPTISSTPIPTIADRDIQVLSSENIEVSGISKFEMKGTAPQSSEVRVIINPDGITSTVFADETGVWKVTIPTTIEGGRKQVSVIATDNFGNQVTKDTTVIVTTTPKTAVISIKKYIPAMIGVGAVLVIVFFLMFLRRLR